MLQFCTAATSEPPKPVRRLARNWARAVILPPPDAVFEITKGAPIAELLNPALQEKLSWALVPLDLALAKFQF